MLGPGLGAGRTPGLASSSKQQEMKEVKGKINVRVHDRVRGRVGVQVRKGVSDQVWDGARRQVWDGVMRQVWVQVIVRPPQRILEDIGHIGR